MRLDSLFSRAHSQFAEKYSLLRLVGNIPLSLLNRCLIDAPEPRVGANTKKFPVNFPASRQLGCRDEFESDCVLRQTGVRIRSQTFANTLQLHDYLCYTALPPFAAVRRLTHNVCGSGVR